jgi:hypothetical protein
MIQPLSTYPPRDRRSGRRWITRRNTLLTLFIGALAFIGFSYVGELRGSKPGNYGRLYNAREKEAPLKVTAPEVVAEAPVPESQGADPMLLDSARRQQYLGVETPPLMLKTQPEISVTTAAATADASPVVPLFKQLRPGQRISITGGSNGLYLDVKK